MGRHGVSFLIALVLSLWLAPAHADNVSYAYDGLGRLIMVVNATSGQATEYSYDAAGNITAIKVVPWNILSIAGISSPVGSPGSTLTIYGTGFSTTVANNTVLIDGIAATVVSATTTQLVVTVPAGGRTGAITVTVNNGGVLTTQSTAPYISIPYGGMSIPVVGRKTGTGSVVFDNAPGSKAPTVTGFSPTSGIPNAPITVTGTNFLSAGQSKVILNQTAAAVTSTSATSLSATVPMRASSGKITVTTPYGSATSAGTFFVIPAVFTGRTISSASTLASGANSVPFSTGQIAVRTFDGTAGQYFTIGVSSSVSTGISVYQPDGVLFKSGTVGGSIGGMQLPRLTDTGTYTIVFDPSGPTTATVTIVSPITGTLTTGGGAQSYGLTPIGQRALIGFTSVAGQYLTLQFYSNFASPSISVLDTYGNVTTSSTASGAPTPASIQFPPETQSVVRQLLIDSKNSSGNFVAELVHAQTATLTVDAPATSASLTLGQRGVYSFTGALGAYYTVRLGASTNSGSVAVTVSDPDGLTIGQQTMLFDAVTGYSYKAIQLPKTAKSGTYKIVVDPGAAGIASYGVTVLSALLDALPLTGSSVLSLAPLRRAVLSFNGTYVSTGQWYTVTLQTNPGGGGGITGLTVDIVGPNGVSLVGSGLLDPPAEGAPTTAPPVFSVRCEGSAGISECYGNSIINIGPIPAGGNGTYTVIVAHTGGGTIGGQIQSILSKPDTFSQLNAGTGSQVFDVLPVGKAMLIPLGVTSNGSYSFTMTETNSRMPRLQAHLINSSGQVVAGLGILQASCNPSSCAGTWSGSSNAGFLTGTDTYRVLVRQFTKTSLPNDFGPLDGSIACSLVSQ